MPFGRLDSSLFLSLSLFSLSPSLFISFVWVEGAQTHIKGSQSIWWILHPILNQFWKRGEKRNILEMREKLFERGRETSDDDFLYFSVENISIFLYPSPHFLPPLFLLPLPLFSMCEDTDDLLQTSFFHLCLTFFSLSLSLSRMNRSLLEKGRK